MANHVGYRIFKDIKRVDQKILDGFRGLPSSNIGDMIGRLYNMDSSIHPINKVPMVGCAFTVKAPMGDNLAFHRALDLAKPGDIIVVDGQGGMERSLAGEMMGRYSVAKGLGGWVINGCLRDVDALSGLSMPIYCKGITPQGPYKFGPGEINVPVCCGGQVVMPGDILVGDQDGIVVIHPEDAEALLSESTEKFEGEQERIEQYINTPGYIEDDHLEKFEKQIEKAKFVYCD